MAKSSQIRTLLLTSIFTLIGIGVISYFTGFHRSIGRDDMKSFSGTADAKIISVEPSTTRTQQRTGSRITIDKYKVVYTYTVDHKQYEQVDYVVNNLKNIELIKELLGSEHPEGFVAVFSLSDPQSSTLRQE